MGENIDPLVTDSKTERLSHRGILVSMGLIVLVGAFIGYAFQGLRFSLGIVIGGLLALGNYLWLDRSTRAIFDTAASTGPHSAAWLAVKYILRYMVMGAVLLLIYLTDAFPVTAVIAGLGAFAAAVVIEGLKNIFTS